jgi:hypothetical protein
MQQDDLDIILSAIKDQPDINRKYDRRLTELESSSGGLKDLGAIVCFMVFILAGCAVIFRPGNTTVTKTYHIEQRCENKLLSFGKCENSPIPTEGN